MKLARHERGSWSLHIGTGPIRPLVVVFHWRYGFDFHWVRGVGRTWRFVWGVAP